MRLALVLIVVTLSALPARAVVLGQVDTFDSGSTQNWTVYPSGGVQSGGGPEGGGDGYLSVAAINQSLAAYNRNSQWSGDYLSAGVNAISIDLANFGPSALEIRLQLDGGSIFQSTNAFLLPPDSQWHRVVFSLALPDLTLVHQKVGGYTDTMSDLSGLNIRHQPGGPSIGGFPITSTLGIDNVTAVPEPSMLTGAILAAIHLLNRRQLRRS